MAASDRRRFLGALLCGSATSVAPARAGSSAPSADKRTFSPYIIRAVNSIATHKSGKGYLRTSSFSNDLDFGPSHTFKAKAPPYTMCVAGVFEVIITALNFYASETGDPTPYIFLPIASWNRLRPFDLRGQIWMVAKSESYGTAHALQKFGMGTIIDFTSLEAGALINLNRTNRSGHAVVFLGYLDRNGRPLDSYSPNVAGFKYFSSQGTEQNGGFGFRYAFFSDGECPALDSARKRDCGVIRASDSILLNSGVMWHPKEWDKRKALEQLSKEAYHITHGDNEFLVDGDYDSTLLNGRTIDD